MENKGIGVSNLPNLLHSEFRKKSCDMNIMVIGSHGLGKTTFLNKIIGNSILKTKPFQEREIGPYWYLEAKCNIQTSKVEVIENEFVTRFNIIEVDGIGDNVDNTNCYVPIVELIESKFDDYMEKFKNSTANQIEDSRIHVCFYFLEPIMSISAPDFETLKRIAPLCTIIPVIAKSDLLSADQIPQMKSYFRNILEQNEISNFNEISKDLPFFIFSESRGDELGFEEGKLWRDTTFQSQHVNDFSVVKRLIFERHAYQLIKDTDQFYDNYRITKLLQESTDKEIREAKERIEKKISDYQKQVKDLQFKIRNERIEINEN